MKRWLVIVGLLVVCHADVAMAASRSPSLLDRILAVFKPQPAHHYVAPNHQAAQKVDSPEAKPAQPLQPAPPVEAATPAEPAHVAERPQPVQAVETVQAVPPRSSPAPGPAPS